MLRRGLDTLGGSFHALATRHVVPLWNRPYRWSTPRVPTGTPATRRVLERWALRPMLALMDPAVADDAIDPAESAESAESADAKMHGVRIARQTAAHLRQPLYLAVDGMQVAGDTVEGVFAVGARGARLDLAIDVGRELIACRLERSAVGTRRAALQWLSRSACRHAMQPEDAPLLVEEIESGLQRLVARLDAAALAMSADDGSRAGHAPACRFDEGYGTRWIIRSALGQARRRAYHAHELHAARAGCVPRLE